LLKTFFFEESLVEDFSLVVKTQNLRSTFFELKILSAKKKTLNFEINILVWAA